MEGNNNDLKAMTQKTDKKDRISETRSTSQLSFLLLME